MIHPFPKIFTVGTIYIQDIFKDEVEITEKIDGSQFVFGKIDGELYMRSKGRQIFPEAVDKMFQSAVDYVMSIENDIVDNIIYYCEYLKKPKHNVLAYNRIPKNHLIVFASSDPAGQFIARHDNLECLAAIIGLETVPLVYKGMIEKPEDVFKLIERESVLGGVQMEGIVMKNYNRPFLLGGQPIPVMAGKYVSEKYKEVHKRDWGSEKTAKGKYQVFMDSFRTEERWMKAVQHLQDRGELENSPRDIGKLIREIPNDITAEEKENIKEFLWREFGKEILRRSIAGFPEWYKKRLLESNFT